MNQLKVQALMEMKSEFLKVRLQDRLSDDAVLSEIASRIRERYERLFQATRLSSLQTKIGALNPFIKPPMTVGEIKEILEEISTKTTLTEKDKLIAICKDHDHGKRMNYDDFITACKELNYE